MEQKQEQKQELKKNLGAVTAMATVVGSVIGSGVFFKPPGYFIQRQAALLDLECMPG